MAAMISTVDNSETLLRQILERGGPSVTYTITLDFFDKYLDDIVASAMARREFTHFYNKGDGTIELYFEKYPENSDWGDTERGKAIRALAGTLSDAEADKLESWIDESRKVPGRVYDWS